MPAFLPSELPVRARVRHHWIVLLTPPHRYVILLLLALLVAAVLVPNPAAWILGAFVTLGMLLRWQTWRAEWVILTGKRIIRLQGVPETTTSESSLRLDRVAGARLTETVPGKLLGYGSIELEAPGEHQTVRRLIRISDPQGFYLELRKVVFGEPGLGDPDYAPEDYATAPLPVLDPPGWRRLGRRAGNR